MSVLQLGFGSAPEPRYNVYSAIEAVNFTGALKDKVAFVTGAGRGIGKAIALAFAEAGAHVALLARTKSQLDEVAEEIRAKYKRNTLVFAVDVTLDCEVAAAFEETQEKLGKPYIVVANAGASVWRPFVNSDFNNDFWKVIETNLKAPLFLAQLALTSMAERDEGEIIIISSIASLTRLLGMGAYCVSKSALNCAVANIQLELDAKGAAGIHIYAVHPGAVETQILSGYSDHKEDMERMRPGWTKEWEDYMNAVTHVPAELCAQTCVYIASGKAKELRGRFIDVERDIGAVVEQAEIVKRENLYDMGVRMLGG